MKDGVRIGLLGIGLGLAGAIALTRVMVSLLFEVKPGFRNADRCRAVACGSRYAGVLHPGTAGVEHPSYDCLAPRIKSIALDDQIRSWEHFQ